LALLALSLSHPSNKESLGQITPLHMVTLGPIFPYKYKMENHEKYRRKFCVREKN
jgi:hypothetical protein